MTDTVDGLTAKQWKRRYDGMVKERDTEVHKKREARRILQERYDQLYEEWWAWAERWARPGDSVAEGRGIEPRRV